MKSGKLILKQVRTGDPKRIAFELTDEAYTREKALKFFRTKMERESKRGKPYEIEAELEIHYQKRTLAQSRLLRALEAVMAFEQDNTTDTAQEYHEGLIQKYCPDVGRPNPVTGLKQKKRTSELNTVEMAQVIGGAFFELATMGIELSSTNIANYWIEWYRWRGTQGSDPFTDKARTIDQYRHDVPVCEACMKGLVTSDEYGKKVYAGQIAHIVSKGSGGTDEVWNLMHLCTECHMFLQHQHSWLKLIEKWVHIAWRVAKAQIQSGRVPSIEGKPEWEPVMKEVNRIRKLEMDEAAEKVTNVFGGEGVNPELAEEVQEQREVREEAEANGELEIF